MELRHLRYLVAVVEAGSFVGAAERIGISQPPLSRQIRDLEEELSVVLLERGRRGVRTTPAGAVFYEGCRALLADVGALCERTRRVAEGAEGVLRVATSQSGAWLMVEALSQFRRLYPGVALLPSELRAAQQATALLRGDVDVTLGYRLPPLEEASIQATELFVDAMVLAAPEATWRPGQGPVQLAELPLLTMPAAASATYRAELLEGLSRIGLRPVEIRGFASVRSVLTLVGCGSGYGVVPTSIAEGGAPGVTFVPIPGAELRLATYAFTAAASAPARSFLGVVRSVVAQRRGAHPTHDA